MSFKSHFAISWVAALIALATVPAIGQSTGAPKNIPDLRRPVHDSAGLLSPQEIGELEGLLEAFRSQTGVQMAIFITDSLEGRDIESYSIAVAEKWKLGRKKEDRGLLMLVAPKEGQIRLEVGYGLEGQLTDVFSKRVLDDVVVPQFRKNEFAEGIAMGIEAISAQLGAELRSTATRSSRSGGSGGSSLVVFVLLFIIVTLIRLLSRNAIYGSPWRGGRRYRGGWGGGGFGGGGFGGGFGGGGGGFGGGGASSRW